MRRHLIIGGGPSAAAAARRFAELSEPVTVVCAGKAQPVAPMLSYGEGDRWSNWRSTSKTQWSDMIETAGEADYAWSDKSPKFTIPRYAAAFARSDEIVRDNFFGANIQGLGGLSVGWGAGVEFWSEDDFAQWGMSGDAFRPHYQALIDIVGVSGPPARGVERACGARISGDLGVLQDDDVSLYRPTELNPVLDRFAGRYLKGRKSASALRWMHAAVRTRAAGEAVKPGHCSRSGYCLTGCPQNAIYSADRDLSELAAKGLIELVTDEEVVRIERTGDDTHWRAHLRSGDGKVSQIEAETLLVAAGAIGSAKLVYPLLGLTDTPRRLLSTPAGGYGVVLPFEFGRAFDDEFVSLLQLGFQLPTGGAQADDAYGYITSLDGLPLWFLCLNMPASAGLSRAILRELASAMLAGNVIFPSKYSDHAIAVGRDGQVKVRGGYTAELDDALRKCQAQLGREVGRGGGILAPGGIRLGLPGSDLHFGGTLPHSTTGQAGTCDHDGAITGLPSIYVVDGAAAPSLPGRAHTFTLMANARRIVDRLTQPPRA
ncbi:hypothetical protein [Maricaulis sp.]|uniref:hypothetical protein n=1 Tax=Maricaulis sp. TaxID=1486257 RepID=UPI002636D571|nr:hypothetical protein [Maricaulis sp.]